MIVLTLKNQKNADSRCRFGNEIAKSLPLYMSCFDVNTNHVENNLDEVTWDDYGKKTIRDHQNGSPPIDEI